MYLVTAQFRSQPGCKLPWLCFFLWFYSVPPGKCWDTTLIKPWHLPSISFPTHQSSHHVTPYSLDTESIVKWTVNRGETFPLAWKHYFHPERWVRQIIKIWHHSADTGMVGFLQVATPPCSCFITHVLLNCRYVTFWLPSRTYCTLCIRLWFKIRMPYVTWFF